MNNNRKMRSFPIALLVLLLVCMTVLAGCNGGEVTDIAISNSGTLRLTYVKGQELDLSGGVLTAMIDGEATSVPLSAEGVTVTGYDKNQVGKQTLTVSYKGKTTTLEITVVARMTVENYKANYFVGDSFDASTGRVKVVNDDGTSLNINLDNPKMVITGFDTSKAGTVTVGVSYATADGTSYEATFDVTVYGAGEVSFTKPSKKAYQSHETELNLSGGYFTVTAEGNSELTQYVNITPDMVSGFDPAAATAEHREKPLIQTLTVTYAGQTFQYEISVLYGAISQIQDTAKTLEDLDWSGPVTLTKEQGEAAVQAISEYLTMSKSDQKLVDDTVLEQVVRPAVQYLTEQFATEAETYSDSFTLDENGSIVFVGKTYEQLAIDTEKLADEEETFNVYAALLREMKETFADMKMVDDVTVGDYIVVTSEEEVTFSVEAFKFLMRLHDTLKDIPEDWQLEDLAAYDDQINTAIYLIQANGLLGPGYTHIFDVIANWRTNNDYFDIIYSYYCYVVEDGQEFLFNHLWQKLPLPGRLQDWYIAFYNAVLEAQFMEEYGNSDAYLRDTTNFMYYYFDALSISEEIKNGDNQFYKDLYEVIQGDAFMDQNVTSVVGGYVVHSNGMVDSKVYNQLWRTYLEVIKLNTEGQFDTEFYREKLEATFDTFAQLTPTEVFGFLASLKYLYAETNGTFLALDYSDKANNTFVYLLANHYIGKLPESARPLFQQMLLAMEHYGIHCAVGAESKGLANFKATMEGMAATLADLSAEDRAVFDDLLGDCYGKYLNIYNAITAPKEFNIDQPTMDRIQQLQEAISAFYEVAQYMSAEDRSEQELKSTCALMYALYEKANSIYEELLASENEDVLTLLYTKKYSLTELEETLENAFFKVRNSFMWSMFFGVRFEQKNEDGEVIYMMSTWSIYEKTQLRGFLRDAADLLWAGYKGTTDQLDPDYVTKITADFRRLDSESIVSLYRIGVSRYFDSLQAYLHGQLAGDTQACDLATAMLEVEFGYMVCEFYNYSQNEINYFKTQFEEAKAIYEQMEDTTACDVYLKQMYDFYLSLYSSLA